MKIEFVGYITWIKDKSLADLDKLPDPDELAGDIVENLEGSLESFKAVIAPLNAKSNRANSNN